MKIACKSNGEHVLCDHFDKNNNNYNEEERAGEDILIQIPSVHICALYSSIVYYNMLAYFML